jgi:hypothetical protein
MLCYDSGDIENYLIATRSVLVSEPNNAVRTQLIEVLIGLAEGEASVIESAQGLPPTLPEGPHLAQEALALLGTGSSSLHARGFTASNDHVSAVTIWKSLIQNDGQSPENWRGLARALESAGDLETAQKCHAKANVLGGETSPDAPLMPLVQPAPVQENTVPLPGMDSTPPQAIEQPVQMVQQPAMSPIEPPHPDEATADFYMVELGLNNEPQAPEFDTQPSMFAAPPEAPPYDPANDPLMQPLPVQQSVTQSPVQPEVDLAKAALDAAARVAVQTTGEVNSMSIANQDIAWYN